MSKETVIVNVPGSPFGIPAESSEIYLGPYTHMRSEGTWLLGVALNMARHGHPTTIIDYQWGDTGKYPLPPNVTLQKGCAGVCDIFIDVGWDLKYAVERFSGVNARHYIHGWGGDPAGSSFMEWQKSTGAKNHYMARTSRCFQSYFFKFPYSIYMPTPLVDKIKPTANFDSKKMLWGNRGAFNLSYTPQSEKVLEFMERHTDYYYKVLLYGDIMEKAKEIGRSDIINRFEKLPNRYLSIPYSGVPHDVFIEELSESKILLANGQPSAHPQTLEAVCYGCIPLLWKNAEHHFQTSSGVNMNEFYPYDLNGPDGVDSILEDPNAWQKYYNLLADTAKDHEYDNSYNIFMDAIHRKEMLFDT
jgi:hypothetical protein